MNSVFVFKKKIPTGLVFLGGLLLYLLAVLPVCLRNGGLFFYYGDYNVQQVPFLIFAHRAVRQGRFFWNPLVDLGGNMGGSFAFYLWGSPFFWLTVPFPEKWLPYIMPEIMALKYGTGAAAAYTWIRTQTKTDRAALIGAFLYAFSGFQSCNIVFQHFHDATAFFPLFLLSFDRLVRKRSSRPAFHSGKAGAAGDLREERAFALMTALMSVVNYYFFFGQVLFMVLYYIVRYGTRRVKADGIFKAGTEVLHILLSGCAGLLLGAVFLVQSIGGILGNARVSKVLDGYGLIIYPDAGTPLAILKSFFMIPDLVARGTLFSNDTIRNGSLAFYLPCFAMAGVFAFWKLRKKSWKKTLSICLCVMAFVPVFCAAFSAMNSNFYTRWFYMPVLICACMTAEALEENESTAFTKGAVLSMIITAVFILMCWLPVKERETWSFTAISENRKQLMAEVRGTLFGMTALLLIVAMKQKKPGLFAPAAGGRLFEYGEKRLNALMRAACILLVLLCCLSSTMTVLKNGSSLISHKGFEKWKRQMLTERPVLEESGDGTPFSRVETDGTSTNYEMVWGYPTMHCFESTVHPSIFTWYRGIGMIRTVESTLPLERIGARAVMSVRYYIENTLVVPDNSYTDQGGIEGYKFLNGENGYNVYETENYIPMGFSFETYMTQDNYKRLKNGVISDRVLVKDLILSDEMVQKYGHLMKEDTDTDPGRMTYGDFYLHCCDRRNSACSEFSFDKNGWHARAQMRKDNLLFFSIPYDEGFSLTVDGKPAKLERADLGLSAVYVPEGYHEIRAVYMPRGFYTALAVSLAAAALLALTAVFEAVRSSRKNRIERYRK